MKLKLSICFFLCIPIAVYSQSVVLPEGFSGFGFSGELITSEDTQGAGGGVEFSSNGVVDVGINFKVAEAKDDSFSGISFSPFVRVFLLKQKGTMPISFSLSARYVVGTYESALLGALGFNVDLTSSGILIRGNIYKKFDVSPSFSIVPTVGIAYYAYKVSLKDPIGFFPDEEEKFSVPSLHGGLSLIVNIDKSVFFGLTPGFSLSEDLMSIGVGLSLYYGFK